MVTLFFDIIFNEAVAVSYKLSARDVSRTFSVDKTFFSISCTQMLSFEDTNNLLCILIRY